MVMLVLSIIMLTYTVFVVIIWGPRIKTNFWIAIPILVFFHIIAFFLLWSFIQTVITDPGEVPIYWGFRVGDPDDRRRRY